MKLNNLSLELNSDSKIDSQYIIIMNAPHLILDELFINKVYRIKVSNVVFVHKLILNASSNHCMNHHHVLIMEISTVKKDQNTIQLINNCKQVDLDNFV